MTKNVFEKCRYHYIKDGYKVYYITTHSKHKHYFNRIKEVKKWEHDHIVFIYIGQRRNNHEWESIEIETTLYYNEINYIRMLNSEGYYTHTRTKHIM